MTREGISLVGRHPRFKESICRARRVAKLRIPLLIAGETGTGKEMVARLVHTAGCSAAGPFVPIDCSALTRDLARAELFGARRGSYTGSVADRSGLVEAAQDGTLFLDEVGELTPGVQAQLLRFLQEGEFRAVGATKVQRSSARVIAATNRDLEADVLDGRFRSDLYYRLNVVGVRLPSLRERRSDIPILVEHFLDLGSRLDLPERSIAEDALEALVNHDWPGNVRQLQHTILSSMAVGQGPVIQQQDLGFEGCTGEVASVKEATGGGQTYRQARRACLDRFNRSYLHQALLMAKGNVTEAARRSGIGRQYFQFRMAEAGIKARDFKRRGV